MDPKACLHSPVPRRPFWIICRAVEDVLLAVWFACYFIACLQWGK